MKLDLAKAAATVAALLAALPVASFGDEARWTLRNLPREKATVVAHRGAGDLAPENCMSSLEMTWEMGGTPEVDVRSTKDGRILMFHDGNFARVCPNAPAELKAKGVEDLTFEEARALDIGSFRGEQFKGEKIISIEEIVDALKQNNRRRVVIDVKNVDFEQLAKAVYDVRFQVTLTSGNEAHLERWAEVCPNADATLWMGLGRMKDADVEARFEKLRASNFKGINRLQIHVTKDADGNPQPSLACLRKVADELRARGIEFQTMAWRTKTCPDLATDIPFHKALMDAGCAGFGADRPDVTFQALDEYYAEVPADWNVRENLPFAEILVQGHRGMGGEAPEGTLETFRAAWAINVVPEADIRMTKDGVIMSFHDNNFKRIIPDAPDDVKKLGVKDFTYEECRKLDVGAYMGEAFKGQQMADLDEMMAALKEDPRRLIFFDVKQVDFEVLAKATESVHPQIILASSKYDEIKAWKKVAPRSKAMLWMPTTWAGTADDLKDRFDKIRDQNFADLDALQVHVVVDDKGEVKPTLDVLRYCGTECRKRGVTFETLSWTNGDKASTYWTLLDAGCASFATDYPTATMKAIGEYYARENEEKK